MSKLDDIFTDATAAAYCAGQDWSPANPTAEQVDRISDVAKRQIKDLVLEIIGEKDMAAILEDGEVKRFGRPDATARNDFRDELRQKVEEL